MPEKIWFETDFDLNFAAMARLADYFLITLQLCQNVIQ